MTQPSQTRLTLIVEGPPDPVVGKVFLLEPAVKPRQLIVPTLCKVRIVKVRVEDSVTRTIDLALVGGVVHSCKHLWDCREVEVAVGVSLFFCVPLALAAKEGLRLVDLQVMGECGGLAEENCQAVDEEGNEQC